MMLEIMDVPIEKIKTGEHALRMEVNNDDVDSLSASIRRVGIIVPLVLARKEDGFIVVAGHRRLFAAIHIGLQSVPAIVREMQAAQTKEVSFAENLFRKDLTPLETAAGIKDTLDEGIMDVPGVAASMNRSEHWVAEQVALLSWPSDVLEAIHSGEISVSAAHNLAMVQDEKYRGYLIRNALENGATARITAAWLQAWRSMEPPEAAVRAEPVPGQEPRQPALPQAPCIVCNTVQRTDAMSMVLICSGCINAIRSAS